MRRKSSGTIEEEMKILRRMGRLLPPGCGLPRRDREKQLVGGRQNFAHSFSARRFATVHGRHRGLRNDDERMEERICPKLKLAISAAYLLTYTPVNFVSAGLVSSDRALRHFPGRQAAQPSDQSGHFVAGN